MLPFLARRSLRRRSSRHLLFAAAACENPALPIVSGSALLPSMPTPELSILIIDENRIRSSIIEDGLREAGHQLVHVVHDINDVARTIEAIAPDVVVFSLEDPNRDRLEHLFSLSRAIERPIAMFVDRSDQATTQAAVEAGVSAYIVDGLRKDRVKSILDMAISRFNAFARLRRELEEARTELQDRKLIDQAKAILMRTRGLSEADAYQLMRKTAMNQNRRIADIAQSLVTAAALLDPKS